MRVYGWVAGGLSLLHNVPQIVHICRRGSADDVSWLALGVRLLSLILYITHGILIEDLPLSVGSGAIFVMTSVMCVQKWHFNSIKGSVTSENGRGATDRGDEAKHGGEGSEGEDGV